jgi:hypothetical protein
MLTSLLTALQSSDFPALLTVPPGFLSKSDRLAGRIGIRASSGSGFGPFCASMGGWLGSS